MVNELYMELDLLQVFRQWWNNLDEDKTWDLDSGVYENPLLNQPFTDFEFSYPDEFIRSENKKYLTVLDFHLQLPAKDINSAFASVHGNGNGGYLTEKFDSRFFNVEDEFQRITTSKHILATSYLLHGSFVSPLDNDKQIICYSNLNRSHPTYTPTYEIQDNSKTFKLWITHSLLNKKFNIRSIAGIEGGNEYDSEKALSRLLTVSLKLTF